MNRMYRMVKFEFFVSSCESEYEQRCSSVTKGIWIVSDASSNGIDYRLSRGMGIEVSSSMQTNVDREGWRRKGF